MRQYLTKAIQDDARRAGERDRLYLEAQRARALRGPRAGSASPVSRLALLLFRRTTALPASVGDRKRLISGVSRSWSPWSGDG
jgi:hypothetical protein